MGGAADQAGAADHWKTAKTEHPYILFVSTIEPRKNVDALLDAYARLRRRDGQAPSLVLAGRPAWNYDRTLAKIEEAGASLLDFRNSGPVAGPAVVRAVKIPVIGGLGGGPWLDGRVRSVSAAIGYLAAALDDTTARYANVAEIALTAIKALSEDVRASRQIRGAPPVAHES